MSLKIFNFLSQSPIESEGFLLIDFSGFLPQSLARFVYFSIRHTPILFYSTKRLFCIIDNKLTLNKARVLKEKQL